MLEFFPFKTTIPFMSSGKVTTAISLLTFIFAVWSLWHQGLNIGVDFTGGTLMEVRTSQPADLNRIRTALEKTGLPEVSVQNFGTSHDVLVRLPAKHGANAAQTSNTAERTITTTAFTGWNLRASGMWRGGCTRSKMPGSETNAGTASLPPVFGREAACS